MDDLEIKRQIMSKIGTLKGVWELSLKRRRYNRSLDQNAYYWVAVVTPFVHWLKDEWGDSIEPEQAHEMLKHKILGVKYKEVAGESLPIVPSTRVLDVEEFSVYVEKCAAWLAEFCGIVVVPSEVFLAKENT